MLVILPMVQLLIAIQHEPINHKESVQFLLHCSLLQLPFCPILVDYVSNQIEAICCQKEISELQGCAARKRARLAAKQQHRYRKIFAKNTAASLNRSISQNVPGC